MKCRLQRPNFENDINTFITVQSTFNLFLLSQWYGAPSLALRAQGALSCQASLVAPSAFFAFHGTNSLKGAGQSALLLALPDHVFSVDLKQGFFPTQQNLL